MRQQRLGPHRVAGEPDEPARMCRMTSRWVAQMAGESGLHKARRVCRIGCVGDQRRFTGLAKLKAELPAELPLTRLRITAVGSDVVVRDRSGQWNADSGQLGTSK